MAPSPQQSIGTNAYVESRPMTLHIGAKSAVSISATPTGEAVEGGARLFLKWKVVFFRGQNLIMRGMSRWPVSSATDDRPCRVRPCRGYPEVYSVAKPNRQQNREQIW
jgi:hypothetical protein